MDKLEKGYVDIQKIKYEIRKVLNRKNDNIVTPEVFINNDMITLFINKRKVLQMEYKENFESILVDLVKELEIQIINRRNILNLLDTINEAFYEEY